MDEPQLRKVGEKVISREVDDHPGKKQIREKKEKEIKRLRDIKAVTRDDKEMLRRDIATLILGDGMEAEDADDMQRPFEWEEEWEEVENDGREKDVRGGGGGGVGKRCRRGGGGAGGAGLGGGGSEEGRGEVENGERDKGVGGGEAGGRGEGGGGLGGEGGGGGGRGGGGGEEGRGKEKGVGVGGKGVGGEEER
ncbi:uncharacterized protein LOC135202145 [Macrobrachium nipponense]|uniref:uncharacterized protein LOC135202145 n=1 Tax=Macrobrachium nipponense TaxID=159736 RepID=UPI0030C8BA8C